MCAEQLGLDAENVAIATAEMQDGLDLGLFLN
jgi:hypothetical protein